MGDFRRYIFVSENVSVTLFHVLGDRIYYVISSFYKKDVATFGIGAHFQKKLRDIFLVTNCMQQF